MDTPLLFRDVDVADMADLDKDDLTSHRFGDAKGFRRHKFYLREPEAPIGPSVPATRTVVSKYDHSPHEVSRMKIQALLFTFSQHFYVTMCNNCCY